MIFLVPFLGAAMGAVSTSMIDMGISDKFIDEVQKVTPGTSALFLLTDDAVVNKVDGALKEVNAELIASNLSPEQEAKLREIFAEDEGHGLFGQRSNHEPGLELGGEER